jgi:hypothetical protein
MMCLFLILATLVYCYGAMYTMFWVSQLDARDGVFEDYGILDRLFICAIMLLIWIPSFLMVAYHEFKDHK